MNHTVVLVLITDSGKFSLFYYYYYCYHYYYYYYYYLFNTLGSKDPEG